MSYRYAKMRSVYSTASPDWAATDWVIKLVYTQKYIILFNTNLSVLSFSIQGQHCWKTLKYSSDIFQPINKKIL